MAPLSDTVIYLDIDGVLNVGISDHANAPLLLHEDNYKAALNVGDTSRLRPHERECFEKVISVAERKLPGDCETGTYRDYACSGKQKCADVFVRRVAKIIKAAGDGAQVVLASNWRLPRYRNYVLPLEREISGHLGRFFAFDSTTEVVNENSASDRLRCIGEHIRDICGAPDAPRALRVLVLDDFFVTPLEGWACGRSSISCAGDVESYLTQCAQGVDATVKVVHCYAGWPTKEGYRVEVGTGLTADLTASALDFLGPIGRRRKAAAPSWASKVVTETGMAIGLLAFRAVCNSNVAEKAADDCRDAPHLAKFRSCAAA